MMIRQSVIDAMRAAQISYMEDTVVRARFVLTPNGAGGFTKTEETVTYAGRVGTANNTPSPELVASHPEARHTRYITLPWDADVKTGDVLTVGGKKYAVLDAANVTYNTARRCICDEVN